MGSATKTSWRTKDFSEPPSGSERTQRWQVGKFGDAICTEVANKQGIRWLTCTCLQFARRNWCVHLSDAVQQKKDSIATIQGFPHKIVVPVVVPKNPEKLTSNLFAPVLLQEVNEATFSVQFLWDDTTIGFAPIPTSRSFLRNVVAEHLWEELHTSPPRVCGSRTHKETDSPLDYVQLSELEWNFGGGSSLFSILIDVYDLIRTGKCRSCNDAVVNLDV